MSIREVKVQLKELERVSGRKHNSLRRRINKVVLTGGSKPQYKELMRDIQQYLNRYSRHGNKQYTTVFRSQDYDANDGFQTFAWGPLVWTFLHILSMNYRREGNENRPGEYEYRSFLEALSKILPCSHCRNNFPKNKAAALIAMTQLDNPEYRIGMDANGHPVENDVYRNRTTFSRFLWELHHQVNIMLGKDITNEPSFEQMRDQLEMFRSRCLTDAEIQKIESEGGCTAAVYGANAKAKCRINFVPRDDTKTVLVEGLKIDPQCKVRPR